MAKFTVQKPVVGIGEDMARSAPSGLKRGVEMLGGTAEGVGDTAALALGALARKLGLPEEATKRIEGIVQTTTSGVLNPIGSIAEMSRDLGGPDVTRAYAPTANTLKEDVESAVPAAADLNYEPQTLPGKLVHKAGEILPSVAVGPGSALTKGLVTGGGAVGGVGGREGAVALNEQLPEDWQVNPETAGNVGDFVGSTLGGMAVPGGFNRVSRPYPAKPGRADLAAVLDREGVPISAGQRTGNEKLLTRESVAGDIPALATQDQALTEAAMRTQGGFPRDTQVASRGAMGGELERMGAEFDRMASISNAPMTEDLLNRLTGVVEGYRENPLIGGRVDRIVNDLFDRSQDQGGGRITGEVYQDANAKIGDIIRGTADDAEREAMLELKGILDDAVGENLPPAEQDSWRTVRQQYRDYLPIENAKAQSSPTAARGAITPSALRTGVKSVEGKREIASGDRPMTELSEAAQGLMEKPAQSGTAPRTREDFAKTMASALTSGGATALGGAAAGLPPPIAGALGVGGAVAPAILSAARDAYTRSGIGQKLLGRQGPVADRVALVNMLSQLQQMQDRREGPQ